MAFVGPSKEGFQIKELGLSIKKLKQSIEENSGESKTLSELMMEAADLKKIDDLWRNKHFKLAYKQFQVMSKLVVTLGALYQPAKDLITGVWNLASNINDDIVDRQRLSKNIGADRQSIEAFGYAMEQLGGSASDAEKMAVSMAKAKMIGSSQNALLSNLGLSHYIGSNADPATMMMDIVKALSASPLGDAQKLEMMEEFGLSMENFNFILKDGAKGVEKFQKKYTEGLKELRQVSDKDAQAQVKLQEATLKLKRSFTNLSVEFLSKLMPAIEHIRIKAFKFVNGLSTEDLSNYAAKASDAIIGFVDILTDPAVLEALKSFASMLMPVAEGLGSLLSFLGVDLPKSKQQLAEEKHQYKSGSLFESKEEKEARQAHNKSVYEAKEAARIRGNAGVSSLAETSTQTKAFTPSKVINIDVKNTTEVNTQFDQNKLNKQLQRQTAAVVPSAL